MKKRLTLLLFNIVAILSANAQQSKYNIAFGTGSSVLSKSFSSIDYTSDNGHITNSRFVDYNNPGNQFLLTKRDSAGTVQWARSWTFSNPQYIYITTDIHQLAGGGYFDCYTGFHSIAPFYDYLAVHADANGNVLWNKSYTPVNTSLRIRNEAQNRQTADGGFAVVADVVDATGADYYYHALKLDSSGNVQWSQLFNYSPFKTYHTNMELCAGGDILICGNRTDLNNNLLSCVTRIDGNGNFKWSQKFKYGGNFNALDIEEAYDGGVVFLSQITDTLGQTAVALTKTDSSGQLLWSRMFQSLPAFVFGEGLQRTRDGGFIIYGTTYSVNIVSSGFILKTDATGNFLWFRRFIGQQVQAADETASGGLVLSSINSTTNRESVIRTDALGLTTCEEISAVLTGVAINPIVLSDTAAGPMPLVVSTGPLLESAVTVFDTLLCQTPLSTAEQTQTVFSFYPNPATETVLLKNMPADAQFTIYDASGRMVFTGNSSTAAIPVQQWPAGFYVLQLNDAAMRIHYKLQVQH
jgi:hypothetical protein